MFLEELLLQALVLDESDVRRLRDDAHALPFQRLQARYRDAFDLDRYTVQTGTKSLHRFRIQ